MKKNDILILAGALIYAILFYHQEAGINYLLFTAFLISALLLKDNQLIKKPSWIALAVGSLASALCVYIYGNTLSVITNLISILVLASVSFQSGSSLIFAALHSVYTFLSALPYLITRLIQKGSEPKESDNTIGIKILIIVLPFLVALIFFFIYRNANPIFKSYTDLINFDFISFEWIRFVLLGWILLYAYFNQVKIAYLYEKDQEGSDTLMLHRFENSVNLPKINYENFSGIILFSLLNVLILFLNMIDFHSILFSDSIPEGITHSELVHQGVGVLIISILFAISIILFYFRGALNFFKTNNTIKILAYLWIIQNMFLIVTTAVKNQWYIDEYSLTYKRIGVYFYLLLTLVGLITTFIKIYSTKSNWFLFRKNGWIFYAILILSCFFNWDLIITRYNLKNSKNPDSEYLLSISYASIPELIKFNESLYNSWNTHGNLYNFLSDKENLGWQSYNLKDARIDEELTILIKNNKFNELNLSVRPISSITCLARLSNLKSLNLSFTNFDSLDQLKQFKGLKSLDLSNNRFESINTLPSLQSLTDLNLSDNPLVDLNGLKNTPNLKFLNIKGTRVSDLSPLFSLHHLESLTSDTLTAEQSQSLRLNFPSLHWEIFKPEVADTTQPATPTR